MDDHNMDAQATSATPPDTGDHGPEEAVDREPTPRQWGPGVDFGVDDPESPSDEQAPPHADGSQGV